MTNQELIPLNPTTLERLAREAKSTAFNEASAKVAEGAIEALEFNDVYEELSQLLYKEYQQELRETLQATKGRRSVVVPGDMVRAF